MAKKRTSEAQIEAVEVAEKIEHWPLSKFKAYKRNAKSHPPEQVKALIALMRRVGFDVPIVVDAKGTVIKGHGRLLAARELGLERVPVIVRTLDAARAAEARIGDNRLGEFGWDFDALVADVVEGLSNGMDIGVTGFTLKELGLDHETQTAVSLVVEDPPRKRASRSSDEPDDEDDPTKDDASEVCPTCGRPKES
jgi:hypothetical protein